MGKKMIVLFPGGNYGVDCPLLYYAGFMYEVAGYTKVKICSYGDTDFSSVSFEEYVKLCFDNVKKQLPRCMFDGCDEIIFASKSIGTVFAAAIEDEYHLSNVMHIMLTPIDLTMEYIQKKRSIKCIVTGTCDNKINHEQLKELCKNHEYPLVEIEGVGHRLEVKDDMQKNISILSKVVSLYK